MITNRRTFFLGVVVFIIPFLGLPPSWKFTLIVLSALTLIFFSIKIELPKNLNLPLVKKPIPKITVRPRRKIKKEIVPSTENTNPATPIDNENETPQQ